MPSTDDKPPTLAHGMAKILTGVLQYNRVHKMEAQLALMNPPKADTFLVTCIDRRLKPDTFLQRDFGEMWVMRNPGNIIPHAMSSPTTCTTEEAAADFVIIHNHVQNVVICGHSDCKAMNGAYDQVTTPEKFDFTQPIWNWLNHECDSSKKKFKTRMMDAHAPLVFCGDSDELRFEALIDVDDKLTGGDRMSQINTLQQVEHLMSYEPMKARMITGEIQMHCLWFDVRTGQVFYFDRCREKKFIEINQQTAATLMAAAGAQVFNNH